MLTLVEDIRRISGIDVRRCGTCDASALPSALRRALDLSPAELVKLILADDREALFASRSLWLLSGCWMRRAGENRELGAVLAAARKLAVDARVAPAEPDVACLMNAFVSQIRRFGRAHHRSLLARMRRRLKAPATERTQEFAMLLGGKLRLRPQKVKDIESVLRAFPAETATGENA
jgi:heterodisulfide reductase subunit C